MKFISLHSKNTSIIYKNSLCSYASIVVLTFIVLSVMIPVLLVSILSPYSGIAESRVLFEQPRVQFKYQYVFVAETGVGNDADSSALNRTLVACSTFPYFNSNMEPYSRSCAGVEYWSKDLDHDTNIDSAHFRLKLDSLPGPIKNFDLIMFFDAKLKHKCSLSPPALLAYNLIVPNFAHFKTGTIHLKAELQLKQYIEFTCPFPGRSIKTNFRHVNFDQNSTKYHDIAAYRLEPLLRELKENPAYFQLDVQETYFREDRMNDIFIQLDMDIFQVPGRYHLSVWERLGQFWLYFASFFGISFYIMNKVNDFLFGHHIIRSWEIIPWKKLY